MSSDYQLPSPGSSDLNSIHNTGIQPPSTQRSEAGAEFRAVIDTLACLAPAILNRERLPEEPEVSCAAEFSPDPELFTGIGGSDRIVSGNLSLCDAEFWAALQDVVSNGGNARRIVLEITRFLHDKSCGECVFCRDGLFHLGQLLEDNIMGRSLPGDAELIKKLARLMRENVLCGPVSEPEYERRDVNHPGTDDRGRSSLHRGAPPGRGIDAVPCKGINGALKRWIKITVDEREYEAEAGLRILDVCLDNGIYIPHLCYHNELHPNGACRLCVVEIDGKDGLFSSCATEALDGMVIRTKSGEIFETRQLSMELMLSGHQADCGTCVKYLNCELQALKQYLVSDEISVRRRSRLFAVTDTNPLFIHEPNKCVLCGRCIRACRDLRGIGILFFKHHHGEIYVGVGSDPELNISLAEAGCRFCGACAEVCPTGAVLDKNEFGKNKSRKEALLPCSSSCPAEIDVPGYIRKIREGNPAGALALIREKVPFPNVLGHICAHPCETVCRRGQVNEPLSICRLKRFAAENCEKKETSESSPVLRDVEDVVPYNGKNETSEPSPVLSGKRAAVIGAGPAGLTAAYYLTLQGHSVTVFEEMPEPGGMLRYGIPEYRLPRAVLEEEIKGIIGTGFKIRTHTRVEAIGTQGDGSSVLLVRATQGDGSAVLFEDFDAVLITVGAQKGIILRIPGVKGNGVLTGVEFLRAVNQQDREPSPVLQRVIVLGGGSVAFDNARVARRLGATEVTVACVESMETIPASREEIIRGEEEGVKLITSVSFKRILRDDGRLTGVEFLTVLSFSVDEDNRLQIETAEDPAYTIQADTVIFAVGQSPDIPEGYCVDITEKGLIDSDTSRSSTSREGVFAAADAVTGTDMVISAIACGRKAAQAIDKYFGGRGRFDQSNFTTSESRKISEFQTELELPLNTFCLKRRESSLETPTSNAEGVKWWDDQKAVQEKQTSAYLGPYSGFAELSRVPETLAPPEERVCNFRPVGFGLSEQQALDEAKRCLQCDLRLKMKQEKFWSSY